MVEYLKTLEAIEDPVVDDGTTGFAMALARKDVELIRILMKADIPSPYKVTELARKAIVELEGYGNKNYSDLLAQLVKVPKLKNIITNSRVALPTRKYSKV